LAVEEITSCRYGILDQKIRRGATSKRSEMDSSFHRREKKQENPRNRYISRLCEPRRKNATTSVLETVGETK
jgi:hypothetical protein